MKKLGLALSSGGARGLAHIGVIKILLKHNIKIDYIAGTSMGAIVGAYFCINKEIAGFEKFVVKFQKKDLLQIFDLNDPRISLMKGTAARNYLEKILGNRTFNDLKVPLKIGATALEDGSRILFDKGNILDAIMASSAFPGILPAVKYKDIHLVDGGLSDVIPVQVVEEMGAQVIVGVNLFDLGHKKQDYKMKEVITRTYEIIMEKISEYNIKCFGDDTIIVKPKISPEMELIDFYNAKHHIKAGEAATELVIPKIIKALK
jgi:NTE family protein